MYIYISFLTYKTVRLRKTIDIAEIAIAEINNNNNSNKDDSIIKTKS